MNTRSHKNGRKNLFIGISQCKDSQNCQPQYKIEILLQEIFFTFFNVLKQSHLNDAHEYELRTKDTYNFQTQISSNTYTDLNNFLRYNSILRSNYKRYSLLQSSQVLEFFDLQQSNIWNGRPYSLEMLVSNDAGKTFQIKNKSLLLGSYFFLSEEKIMHNHESQRLVDIVSIFSGLNRIVFVFLNFFCQYFNEQKLYAKFIRTIFIERDSNKKS